MALLLPVLRDRASHQRSLSIISRPGAHESLGDTSIAVRTLPELPIEDSSDVGLCVRKRATLHAGASALDSANRTAVSPGSVRIRSSDSREARGDRRYSRTRAAARQLNLRSAGGEAHDRDFPVCLRLVA
jgi:hypothetical protein